MPKKEYKFLIKNIMPILAKIKKEHLKNDIRIGIRITVAVYGFGKFFGSICFRKIEAKQNPASVHRVNNLGREETHPPPIRNPKLFFGLSGSGGI
jgi:hypothetical protein